MRHLTVAPLLPALGVGLLLGAVQSCATQGASAGGSGAASQVADRAASPQVLAARWEQRKISFTYMGFTAKYSCDGLEQAVRTLLLAAGARKQGMDLRETGCVRAVGPTHFPGVDGTFWVLVPAEAGAADTVPARWDPVDLARARDFDFATSGDCEVYEQFQRSILPLLTTRNVQYRSLCTPYTATAGGLLFKLEALRPVPPAAGVRTTSG
jgi:hypothetical protein